MIQFEGVSFSYPGSDRLVLADVNLEFNSGELALVIGPTGAGKSTLLKAVAGLVPHFTGGTLHGSIRVDGRRTQTHPPRRLADLVGYVGQDPAAGFVADRVEDELAYAMEQQGIPVTTMRARVEEVLDLLGIAPLRDRDPLSLSAGEAQRVAIGASLTAHPKILVLDEPTSALDPAAAEEVMAAISRLVDDLDLTVLMAEHRLERVIQFADRIVRVDGDGSVSAGTPRTQLATSPVAPPLVRLARALAWTPLPLTVREGRRAARACAPPPTDQVSDAVSPPAPNRPVLAAPSRPVLLEAKGVSVTHPGPVQALNGVSLQLRGGQITGLMGRNGAGKTSLLWALAEDRKLTPPGTLVLVPAQPTDLFYANSVAHELPNSKAAALLDRIAPGIARGAHPRDLSEGQRLALALAIQLTADTQVVALDEPTRGLDYSAKDRLAQILRELADQGKAVLVATHDVEFLALAADSIIWLAEGQIVGEGPAAEFLLSVPAHAPQIAKVMAPREYLTVEAALVGIGGER
ncbi:MAG: ATP-binding cassette domain-containing protein [Bifidobacteriaceae bacterium]|jgi:energy-coupling factor transport system ATP-binding protein|nr:ATP-binding cassette domain-containing protein [Bifidobacteriaceae bacterium]